MVDRLLLCLASWLAFSHKYKVSAYYCDNDKCDFDEYCCGHNTCCTSYNVTQMWYFWLGLVLFLILLAGCFSFWRYRYQQALVVQGCRHPSYSQLQPSMSIPSAEASPYSNENLIGHTYNIDRGSAPDFEGRENNTFEGHDHNTYVPHHVSGFT